MPPFKQIKAVESDGTPMVELDERANPKTSSWVLNQPGAGSFGIHPLHPQAGDLRDALVAGGEIQMWRDDVCVWWGRPKSVSLGRSELIYQCAGLLDYFTDLHFGPVTTNYAEPNASFEDDLDDWIDSDGIGSPSTTVRYMGDQAARVDPSGPGADEYLEKVVNFDTGADGLAVFASARVWIDAGDWAGPALEERGIVLAYDTASIKGVDIKWEPITENTPKGEFRKLTTHLNLAADLVDEPVSLRLMGVPGVWDDVVWAVEESVSTSLDGQTDVATFIADLLAYLAGKAAHLNLALTNPSTGVKLIRAVQFYESLKAADVFKDFPAMGACDIEIAHNAAGDTRTLVVHPGAKGTLQSAFPLKVDVDDEPGSALTMQWVTDLAESKNYGWVMGEGTGATRDVAVASDLDALGGIRQEFVLTAPPGTPKGALQGIVDAELARRKNMVEIPTFTIPAEGWLGVVVEGDTVPVTVDYGWAQLPLGNRRIVAQTLNWGDDTITPVLNP